MHSFKDSQKRQWTFEVNVLAVSRVRKQLDLDLLTLMDPEGETFARISTDTILLCDVMLVILEDQLCEQDVSPEDFLRAIDNEEIVLNATRACMDAILSFSRKPKATMVKTAFGKVWDKTMEREQIQVDQAMELVESEEFDEAVARMAEEVIPGRPSSD